MDKTSPVLVILLPAVMCETHALYTFKGRESCFSGTSVVIKLAVLVYSSHHSTRCRSSTTLTEVVYTTRSRAM